MLVQDETHPRLATRAYECYEWSQSAQYAGIIDGTFTLPDKTKEINQELEHYTNHADKADYAFAVASGIISGAIDALFVGDATITGNDIALSNRQVNNFIQEYASSRGFNNSRLKDAIREPKRIRPRACSGSSRKSNRSQS